MEVAPSERGTHARFIDQILPTGMDLTRRMIGGKNDVDRCARRRLRYAAFDRQSMRFMSTFFAKKEEQKPRWYVIDASNQVLGKVAVKAANVLRGKVKPTFTPHVDAGDFVVVVNAEKVVVTGRKETAKVYMSYSQYPGKEKRRTVKQVRATHPEKLIEHAVKGMIPRNRLGRQMITKLKVYAGAAHPHGAQKPEPVSV